MRRAMVVGVLGVLVAVAACTSGAGDDLTIVAADYSQYQAINGWQDPGHEITDAQQLADLAQVITEHDLPLDGELGTACPGGLSTELTFTLDDGSQHTIALLGCEHGEGGDALNELVGSWA